ncbi:MAG: hypothetical protein H0Z33_07590 [Bacillaceae bacterium]|nr:hypothetical protein [Bacillaceae bacterium]
MKIDIKWMIGIIILTNLLTFTVVKVYFPTTIHNNSYFLKMKGQGEHWNITDYEFVRISGHGAMQGSANVTYLGDPNQLTGRIKVDVYDYFKDGATPHSSYSVSADRLDDNASFVTGGRSSYPPDELGVRDLVERTYFIIHWRTSDGVGHQETIAAELDYDPRILGGFHGIDF